MGGRLPRRHARAAPEDEGREALIFSKLYIGLIILLVARKNTNTMDEWANTMMLLMGLGFNPTWVLNFSSE